MKQRGKATERNIIAAERRTKILQLRKAGYDYQSIAEQVGVTKGRISQILKKALEDYAHETSEETEELRRIEVARLDNMLRGLWPRAISGNLGAVDRVIKIMERRARLLGLDSPIRNELLDKDGEALGTGLAALLKANGEKDSEG